MQNLLQCIHNQIRIHPFLYLPNHNAPSKHINDEGGIHKALWVVT